MPLTEPPMFTWKFDGERVYLINQTGDILLPSAEQIFSCAFMGSTTVNSATGLDNPLKSIKNLSFSRFPAQAAVRTTGDFEKKIQLDEGVIINGNFTPLIEGQDQVVVSSQWIPIDLDSIKETRLWLEQHSISSNSPLTIRHLIAIRSAISPPFTLVDETELEPARIEANKSVVLTEIHGLNADLYSYQRDGVAFLQLISSQGIGCVLADEMGLGKTLQVIALIQSEKNADRGPTLIIAPATLLENWRREICNFAPQLNCLIHSGADRPGITARLTVFDVVVTSFDTAMRDEPLLKDIEWNLLVLDEAQAIKNPDAQRSISVKKLPRRVSVAVTGTPVENRLTDLWSISDFALPGLLGTKQQFETEFSDQLDDAGRLSPIVAPIILRRKVEDVAKDLPVKIEIPQPIQMTREMAELYESVRKQALIDYGASAALVATTKLRVLCAHPSLDYPWSADPQEKMSKYQRLLEILDEIFASNEKVLIFTTYQAMSDLFLNDLPKRWKAGYFKYIDGRIPVLDRQPIVDSFYSHAGFGALFLNPKAAGTGLNITAANHVIHYNPEWNPALTAQASARAYRRKQTRPVTIHYLYFIDTVEELIMGRAGFKQQLAAEVISGDSGDPNPSELIHALQISPLVKFS